MITADLHCHSVASDGHLTPQELVARAEAAAVNYFAITDHDTVAGYMTVADGYVGPLKLVAGVELSSQFNGMSVHIVGLNVDVNSEAFKQHLASQAQSRMNRAQQIAEKLTRAGLHGVSEFIASLGDKPVSRPDIAQYLVASGQVGTVKQAFDKYLGAGKAGDVKQFWPDMTEAVQWIKDAGGVAVFAHPESYKITRTKLRKIIDAFVDAGGAAIELPHEPNSGDFWKYIGRLAAERELAGSVGSDFHTDQQPWRQIGRVPQLPNNLQPVWELF